MKILRLEARTSSSVRRILIVLVLAIGLTGAPLVTLAQGQFMYEAKWPKMTSDHFGFAVGREFAYISTDSDEDAGEVRLEISPGFAQPRPRLLWENDLRRDLALSASSTILVSPDPTIGQLSRQSASTAFGTTSLFGALQDNYTMWEQQLGDTRLLTDDRGIVLYSLLQVDFGYLRLPIVMYVPALRGSPPNPR
jgi:hypothetical protein